MITITKETWGGGCLPPIPHDLRHWQKLKNKFQSKQVLQMQTTLAAATLLKLYLDLFLHKVCRYFNSLITRTGKHTFCATDLKHLCNTKELQRYNYKVQSICCICHNSDKPNSVYQPLRT